MPRKALLVIASLLLGSMLQVCGEFGTSVLTAFLGSSLANRIGPMG
jgi:hypothetical protein